VQSLDHQQFDKTPDAPDGSPCSRNDLRHEGNFHPCSSASSTFVNIALAPTNMPPLLFSGHRGPIYVLIKASGADEFYSGSGDGLVVKWHTARPDSGSSVADVGQAVFALALLPGHEVLLAGTESGDLHVVDLRTRSEVQLLKVHSRGLYRILVMPDQRIVCAGGDGSISVWSHNDGRLELQRHIPLSESKLRDLAISPDRNELAVAAGDGTIRILDTELFNERYTLEPSAKNDAGNGAVADDALIGMSALAYHPEKPVLISGGKDGYLRTWQSNYSYRSLLHLPVHKGTVYQIAFSPDGTRCATASRDKSAKLWDANTFDPQLRMDRSAGGHTHSVNAVLWIGQLLLTGSDDRRILGWKIR
jgi:WD repeat-containing protein 61